MKKPLIVIFILLLLVIQVKGTYSQTTEAEPIYGIQPLPPAAANSAVSGQGPYYTHPEITNVITTSVTIPAQNTADGYIFLGTVAKPETNPTMMLLDDTGEPIYIQPFPTGQFVGDVKKQTVNGVDYLTYHSGVAVVGYTNGTNYVLDQNYQLVDTWTIGNDGADIHDFILLDNGHAIQLAYVPTPYDLTPYGGPANGTLVDIIIQEQDANKNVVFEWVGSEHLPIDDTELDLNTTDPIDYLHTNAIEIDDDGNWLLSHRNFSEITKIDRQTGDIIWRMGGQGNEFTFTNDIGFWNQHHIRRLPNGNITLFDNGNLHTPPHSRAIEYALDENAKTVTRVWVYPDDTSEFSPVMSNMQRLSNNNSMIGWGSQSKLTEVQYNGSVALEMLLGSSSYRIFRFPWSATPLEAPRAVLQYGADPTAVTIYTSWNGATGITGYDIYAGPTTATMVMISTVPRTGFETEISLTSLPADTCFFQTKPVQAQGNPTPYSNMMFRIDLPACWAQLNHSYLPILPSQ